MTFSLEDFVAESNRIEGISSTSETQIEAHRKFLEFPKITISVLEDFVSIVQPGATLRRSSNQNVRVGGYIAPPGGPRIEEALENILYNLEIQDSYTTHLDYLNLYPFTDGNGCSGRVLWLWCRDGVAPLGFLHQFYYHTLAAQR